MCVCPPGLTGHNCSLAEQGDEKEGSSSGLSALIIAGAVTGLLLAMVFTPLAVVLYLLCRRKKHFKGQVTGCPIVNHKGDTSSYTFPQK